MRGSQGPSLNRTLANIQQTVENRQRVQRAQKVAGNPDLAFLARELVQCTLPHSDPGKRTYKTTNGLVTVMIESGTDQETERDYGVPYGIIPRLLLYYINTQAVANHGKDDPRKITFGRNLHQFMRELGLNPESGSGKRSDYRRMVEQAQRLFAARISVRANTSGEGDGGDGRDIAKEGGMLVSKFRDLWWECKNPYQDSLWESTIILDEDFYRAITSSPVPVSMEILKQIKRSPLALDLYGWVNYRTYMVNKTGEPVTIPLSALAEQFGASYSCQKEFNRKFRLAMAKLQKVQPGLRFNIADGAITLHPGRTAIGTASSA